MMEGRTLGEEKDKEKAPDYNALFGMKILGIDFSELLRNWLGVGDLNVLNDPAQAEALKKRLEEQRTKLKDAQEQLKRRFGDAVRFDYDIRIKTLGETDEVRVGGGKFFDMLDKMSRERSAQGETAKPRPKPAPYRKREGVVEPFTEVIDEKDYVGVLAELPGIEEKDIDVKIQPGRVLISTLGPERIYKAEVPLPASVFEEPSEKTYLNGVLKLRLKKSLGNR